MLKQSPSRNQRSKGFKLKHAIHIFVVLAICIWMLYQLEHFALKENSTQVFPKGLNGEQILRLGRKDLNPRLNELAAEFEKHQDEELELEDEERKLRDNNGDEGSAGDEELDASDQEKTEEGEHEQLEDLIDEDDKED